jgi:TonB family protein
MPALPQDAAAPIGEEAVASWLRMAALALESGMLVEPEGSNAWSLYQRAREQQPSSVEATQGLQAVANALAERGNVALEQGRLADAEAVVALILATLPDHVDAGALRESIAAARARAAEGAARAAALRAELQAASASAPPAALPAAADPMAALGDDLERALAENRLLTPAGANAREIVDRMIAAGAQHPLTQAGRNRLFAAFMARADQASVSLDTRAAGTWLDHAASLDVDARAVDSARSTLIDRLADAESARPVPAAELALLDYVPPAYPQRAVLRELEGWVDLEFTVAADGTTRDVVVTEASDELFHAAALEAVTQWRFEPRVFMDRVIEQRASTRIRFALQ